MNQFPFSNKMAMTPSSEQWILFLVLTVLCYCASPSHLVDAFSLDALSLTTNAAAAFAAGVEVFEDIENIGHGHGILLITGSRLCRDLNVIRESVADEGKKLFKITERSKSKQRHSPLLLKWSMSSLRFLTNPTFIQLLSLCALIAAWIEVIEDFRPGGHHGSVLLAVHELVEVQEDAGRPVLIPFVRRPSVQLSLVTGAVVVALWETLFEIVLEKNASVGAHHGVFFLGIGKFLRFVGLFRKDKKKMKAKRG